MRIARVRVVSIRGVVSNRSSVTVGIPTYNNQATVAQTIRSLRQQSFTAWECIVADDSRTKETYESAREAIGGDSRFEIISNVQRLGPAGNWNSVLRLATAPLFKLLCADDILFEQALERQVAALNTMPSAVLATSRRDVINSNEKVIFRDRGYHSRTNHLDRSEVIRTFVRSGRNLFAEPSFALYDTEALRQAGGFNAEWSYVIDFISYLSILEHGKMIPVNESLGAFRISSDAWTSNLAGTHRAEIRRCIKFATSLPDSRCSSFDVLRGRALTNVTSLSRNLILRFSTGR